tara:strand:+ start:5300 stop:5614 length:315 start_codon:yes stop_codon:yes gene_type:complete
MSQRGLHIIPRPVNNHTIKELGLTSSNVRDIISALSIVNYSKGPEQDYTHPSQHIYVFGDNIDGVEVYIKLTIGEDGDLEIPKCISFHKADFPIKYPMKSGSSK